jgi:hypothetical protein
MHAEWPVPIPPFAGVMLVFQIACASPTTTPTPPAPSDAQTCRRYDDPDLQAFCVTSLAARGLAGPSDCNAVANTQVQTCRAAWVHRALAQGQESRTTLLTACGAGSDCILAVLDARPLGETTEQLASCRDLAGPYAQDCTIHALQRWASQNPSEASFARVAAERHFGSTVGALLGLVVGCQGTGSCDQASPAAREACKRAVEQDIPSRPSICELALSSGQR